MLKPWKLIQSKDLLKNNWIHLKEERLITESGGVIEPFYRFITKNWGLVIPQTRSGEFILVRQYRRGVDDFCLEFPAGAFHEEEEFDVGMRRELSEETGYTSSEEMTLLGKFSVNPANQAGQVGIYSLTDVRLTDQPEMNPTEELEIVIMTQEELKIAFKTGEIVHPMHHLAWHLHQCDVK